MTVLARTHCIALDGLRGVPVEVQTHIGPGIVGTTLVGLPDASLREAKERVRAAMFSSGVPTINRRVTVNLAPADLPKTGSGFDVAIALSMLIAAGLISEAVGSGTIFMAELGLDGSLLAVAGVLPAVLAATEAGFSRVVVAPANAAEARLTQATEVIPCRRLGDLLSVFGSSDGADGGDSADRWRLLKELGERAESLESSTTAGHPSGSPGRLGDLADVQGQEDAVRALTIAAVGAHHALFHGPPGSGKTMLASRLPGILPDLSRREALTVTAIRSLAARRGHVGHGNQVNTVQGLVVSPPFEAPHHSATLISLVGGGNPVRPGAVSMAHGGVLLLDEAPEFNPRTLDALRQPLEQGEIAIYRARSRVILPARFQMILTANPCPCGGDDGSGGAGCTCSSVRRRTYRSRLSGPLLDRVDMQVNVTKPARIDMLTNPTPSSASTREAVTEARARTAARLRDTPWQLNAQVPGRYIRQSGLVEPTLLKTLEHLLETGVLTLRGADRLLRMAWSCADYAGRRSPSLDDLSEAMHLRGLDGVGTTWI